MAIATPTRHKESHAKALVALMGVALLAVACSDKSATPGVANLGSAPTATTPAAPAPSPQPFAGPQQEYQYVLSYAECMRTHGVVAFPDPTKSAHGFSFNPGADSQSPHFPSANDACKRLLPDNGGAPTPAQLAVETSRLLKYTGCMRSHGIPQVPDPIVNTHEIGFSLQGIKPNAPQFQSAQRDCKSLLPGGGP